MLGVDGVRFGLSAVLGVLLFTPAALLVSRGDLSVDTALVRFGSAWAFAVLATALIASTMSRTAPATPVRARAAVVEQGAPGGAPVAGEEASVEGPTPPSA